MVQFQYGKIKCVTFPHSICFPVDLAVRYKLCFGLIRGICSVVERWHKIDIELWLSKVRDVDQHLGQTFLLHTNIRFRSSLKTEKPWNKLFGRKRSTSQPLTSF